MAVVCSCLGITSQEIRCEINSGARTIAEIGAICGAGTCCESCHPTIEVMIQEAKAGKPRVRDGRRRLLTA